MVFFDFTIGINSKTKGIATLLENPIDILVTTPSALRMMIRDYDVALTQLTRIVLDEADTLFDRNFLRETNDILEKARDVSSRREHPIPVMMVTATFPQTLNQATKDMPDLIRLTTPTLHSIPTRIHQDFMRLNQSTTKANLLLETIRRISTTKRVLVFCNTHESALEVYDGLVLKNIPSVILSSRIEQKELDLNLKAFTATTDSMLIAVSTDISSRGIDTTQVGHVIIHDFPHTVIDYMHRAGRTGRFGREGRVTSFITKRDVTLAEAIQATVKSRTSLPARV